MWTSSELLPALTFPTPQGLDSFFLQNSVFPGWEAWQLTNLECYCSAFALTTLEVLLLLLSLCCYSSVAITYTIALPIIPNWVLLLQIRPLVRLWSEYQIQNSGWTKIHWPSPESSGQLWPNQVVQHQLSKEHGSCLRTK